MPRFTLKRLLIVVTAIACALGFLRAAYVAITHFETGENVDQVAWSPNKASNVSYYCSYSSTSYEFDISESEFKRWSWWELNHITAPVKVMRYTYHTRSIPDVGPNPTRAEEQRWERDYESQWAIVSDGLYHVHQWSGGGGVWVAYDRKQGRAYYHSSPR